MVPLSRGCLPEGAGVHLFACPEGAGVHLFDASAQRVPVFKKQRDLYEPRHSGALIFFDCEHPGKARVEVEAVAL